MSWYGLGWMSRSAFRAPLGTGKTAVGLHRAAYLLYAHRSRLQRSGVLVLGPNRAFLHYISAVLPTLGELDVEQTTVEQLLTNDRHQVRSTDEPAAARVKHEARMAEILGRALYGRIRAPREAVVVRDGSPAAHPADRSQLRGRPHWVGLTSA